MESKSNFMILYSLKIFNYIPNAYKTYRVILNIHITTIFAKQILLKLKLLNSYFSSIISQDRKK